MSIRYGKKNMFDERHIAQKENMKQVSIYFKKGCPTLLGDEYTQSMFDEVCD